MIRQVIQNCFPSPHTSGNEVKHQVCFCYCLYKTGGQRNTVMQLRNPCSKKRQQRSLLRTDGDAQVGSLCPASSTLKSFWSIKSLWVSLRSPSPSKMILAADELFYNFPSERGTYLVYNDVPLVPKLVFPILTALQHKNLRWSNCYFSRTDSCPITQE